MWTAPDGSKVIVEGHGRKLALQELGAEEVPCIMLDHLDDEGRRAYGLAHNQTTLMTGFDVDKLDFDLGGITDYDMADFGFDFSAGDEPGEIDAEDDEYEVQVPDEPKSEKGAIYRLGDHYLMCGDSTSSDDVSDLMTASGEVAFVDCVIQDPPYGVSYVGKTKDALTIENDTMKDEGLQQFLVDAFGAIDPYVKPGGSFYVWHASSTVVEFVSALRKTGWQDRQQLIWVKNVMVLGRSPFQWRHEPCLFGWKSGAAHSWYSDRKQTTVLEFDKPARNADHPTMKPIPLIAYQMGCSTEKGQIVADMFGGSGTTLLAAEQLGRVCYTMELDPRYCDVIIDRWEQYTGRKSERIR